MDHPYIPPADSRNEDASARGKLLKGANGARIKYHKEFLVYCFRNPACKKKPDTLPDYLEITLNAPRINGMNPCPPLVPYRALQFVNYANYPRAQSSQQLDFSRRTEGDYGNYPRARGRYQNGPSTSSQPEWYRGIGDNPTTGRYQNGSQSSSRQGWFRGSDDNPTGRYQNGSQPSYQHREQFRRPGDHATYPRSNGRYQTPSQSSSQQDWVRGIDDISTGTYKNGPQSSSQQHDVFGGTDDIQTGISSQQRDMFRGIDDSQTHRYKNGPQVSSQQQDVFRGIGDNPTGGYKNAPQSSSQQWDSFRGIDDIQTGRYKNGPQSSSQQRDVFRGIDDNTTHPTLENGFQSGLEPSTQEELTRVMGDRLRNILSIGSDRPSIPPLPGTQYIHQQENYAARLALDENQKGFQKILDELVMKGTKLI